MHIEDIEYTYEGRRLVGRLAVDDSRPGRRPAVLVCHEGGGLGPHAKEAAERLAGLGYVAFALDYYGDGKELPSDEVMGRFTELQADPALTRALGGAGLDVLLADEHTDPARVAAIGYCFGGTVALELGRGGADLRAIIGFHAGLSTVAPAEDARNIRGKVLMIIGSDDPFVPAEQRAAFEVEMRGGGVDWQLLVLGGNVHSFTNPAVDAMDNPAVRYDAVAEARSWRALVGHLEEAF